jgi:hypothetical protein
MLYHSTNILVVLMSMLTDVARLGEVEKSRDASHSWWASYPFGRKPLATYTFKYRSRRTFRPSHIVRSLLS